MARPLPPVTPGEVLREEFMEPLGLSANRLAKALNVPTNRVTGILNGTRSVTADTALRLSLCFDTTPEFWLNLQHLHDLEIAKSETGPRLKRTVKRAREIKPAGRAVNATVPA